MGGLTPAGWVTGSSTRLPGVGRSLRGQHPAKVPHKMPSCSACSRRSEGSSHRKAPAASVGQASKEATKELQEGWLRAEQWSQDKQQPRWQPWWQCPTGPFRVVYLPSQHGQVDRHVSTAAGCTGHPKACQQYCQQPRNQGEQS